jgi:hypothetical protein
MVERAAHKFCGGSAGHYPERRRESSRYHRRAARPHERKGHSLIKAVSQVPAGLPGLPRLTPAQAESTYLQRYFHPDLYISR